MAQMKFRAPVTGVETWKYKAGASGGGFGTDAASQPSGAALTITDDNEVALAGANDPVDRILDTVNVNTGQCRVFNSNVGEIEGIITEGRLPSVCRLSATPIPLLTEAKRNQRFWLSQQPQPLPNWKPLWKSLWHRDGLSSRLQPARRTLWPRG